MPRGEARGKDELGQIEISDAVIAELAGFGALKCYGVVGMASPTLQAGVAQLLSRDRLQKGIQITRDGDVVAVDLFVIIEYGTNLAEVARNLREQVRYAIEKQTELTVSAVTVHVQGGKVRK